MTTPGTRRKLKEEFKKYKRSGDSSPSAGGSESTFMLAQIGILVISIPSLFAAQPVYRLLHGLLHGGAALVFAENGHVIFYCILPIITGMLLYSALLLSLRSLPALNYSATVSRMKDIMIEDLKIAPDTPADKRKQEMQEFVQGIAAEYDLEKISPLLTKRSLKTCAITLAIMIIPALLALNNYVKITDNGIAVSRLWQPGATLYSWDQVEFASLDVVQVNVSSTKGTRGTALEPNFVIRMKSGDTVDIWDMAAGLPAQSYIRAAEILKAHGVELRKQDSLLSLDRLNPAKRDLINEVFNAEVFNSDS